MSDERATIETCEEAPQGVWTVSTYEEYCSIEERVEIIDGTIYDMGSPTANHQIVTYRVHAQLDAQLEGKQCQPFGAPMDVKLPSKHWNQRGKILDFTIVQPDVFIICDPDKNKDRYIDGAPDFILEVLSPGTQDKDFFVKFNKYMETGVREYWLLDVKTRKLTLIVFLSNGQSEREERKAEGCIALRTFGNSVTSGLYIDFDKVFSRVKP